MKYLKRFEAYSSFEEYRLELMSFLKKYSILPSQLGDLLDFYEDEIRDWYESGKYTRELAEKIAKRLDLGTDTFMQYKGGASPSYQQIKYL